jgi:hypothetical protein
LSSSHDHRDRGEGEEEEERKKLLNKLALLSHPALGGDPTLSKKRNQSNNMDKKSKQKFTMGNNNNNSNSNSSSSSWRSQLKWYQLPFHVVKTYVLKPMFSVIGFLESFFMAFSGNTSGEEPLFKLKCGHSFHERCLRGWTIVGKQHICP